jgi:hypothetical protein
MHAGPKQVGPHPCRAVSKYVSNNWQRTRGEWVSPRQTKRVRCCAGSRARNMVTCAELAPSQHKGHYAVVIHSCASPERARGLR